MITVFFRSRLTLSILFLGLASAASSQQNILDSYIRVALERSPVLHQDSLALSKAKLAKAMAESYYLPTAGFQFGYQASAGGRSIDLPVGDMLNGVYATLNQLTGSSAFPTIKNEQINFFPQNFYDAKIRTTVPVFNPEVRPGISLANGQVKASVIEIQLRKRELVRQVKEAYFDYLLARKATQIFKEAHSLAEEGRRVNERLLKNGKGLPAYVLRSDAEVESINAELYQAEVQALNARAWFNFLLDRPAETDIDTGFNVAAALAECYALAAANPDPADREEIKALENASLIYEAAIGLNKSTVLPKVNGILDLGSQAENWQFNNQSRYFLLGLQLEVPIYSASRTKRKIMQSRIDLQQNQSKTEYVARQLRLSAQIAVNELRSALASVKAKEKQSDAAATYLRLIDKGYAEGVSSFIETVDARNQWAQSRISYRAQLYKVLKAGAVAERELALYQINP